MAAGGGPKVGDLPLIVHTRGPEGRERPAAPGIEKEVRRTVRDAYLRPDSSPFLFVDPDTAVPTAGDLLCYVRGATAFGHAGLQAWIAANPDAALAMHCGFVPFLRELTACASPQILYLARNARKSSEIRLNSGSFADSSLMTSSHTVGTPAEKVTFS